MSKYKNDISEFFNGLNEEEISITQAKDKFFELSIDLICIADFEGYFLFLNPAWERTLGYSLKELKAKPYFEYIHPEDLNKTNEAAVTLSENRKILSFENRYICKDGSIKWLSWNSIPVAEEKRIYAVARDITDKKLLEVELKEKETRLELALKGGDLGLWDWNIKTGDVIFNKRWAEMIGYELNELKPNVSQWEELVHPEDMKKINNELEKHFSGEISYYSTEHRMKSKSGDWIWILDKGKIVERDSEGKPLKAVGTHMDITERKKNENILSETASKLKTLIANLQKGILMENNKREITHINQTFCDMFNIPVKPEILIGSDCSQSAEQSKIMFKHPDEFVRRINEILAKKETVINEEIPLADGRTFERDYIPIFENKNFIGNLWSYRDITERKNAELKIQSLYDEVLEDINTAASIQEYLIPEWITPFSDIVFFSSYNPSSNVGGDVFDIIPLEKNKYFFYIADISGHGVQAALLMTAVKSVIKMIVETKGSEINVANLVSELNGVLCRNILKNNYMTILLGVLDTEKNEFKYFNAGHPPIIVYSSDEKNCRIIRDKGSIPIGWDKNYEYSKEEENKLILNKNEGFLCFTDGLFECIGKDGEQLGLEGIREIIRNIFAEDTLEILPQKLECRMINNNYDITSDDFTLVSFKPLNRQKFRYFRVVSVLEEMDRKSIEIGKYIYANTDNEDAAAKAELLTAEFGNNIIVHGYERKPDQVFFVSVEISDKIIIRFFDKGKEWFMDSGKDWIKIMLENVEIKSSGRGIGIIKSLSRNFDRRRYAEVNETFFEINLH